MKNASMLYKNRNKSRENETDRSKIKIESINVGLGAELMDKKLNSYIELESQIKAIQIKKNVKKINLSRTKSEKISEKKQRLMKTYRKGKANGTVYVPLTREKA